MTVMQHASSQRYTGTFLRGVFVLSSLLLSPLAFAGNAKADDAAVKQDSSKGVVTVSGNVRGMAQTTQRADGAVVVHGKLSGKGRVEAEHVIIEGELSPGNSPGCIDFGGNVTFNSTAVLLIEMDGPDVCTNYDRISVAGKLTINNATLELNLLNGYVPEFRQRFDVLDWGSISGSFATIDTSAATLPYPQQWDLSQLYISGEVIVGVTNIADGDLAPFDNPDGVINAADILIAQQLALGQREAGALQYAHGDMNGDDVIDVVDLLKIQQLVFQ
jgi:hypothetical protein